MKHPEMKKLFFLGGAVVLAMALVGCETIEQERRAEKHEEASRRCSTYGAREGSRAYDDCMRRQHHRSDRDRHRDRN